MDTYDYEYYCPFCNEGFLGEISLHKDQETKEVICGDCGGKFKLNVKFVQRVDVECERITTSST